MANFDRTGIAPKIREELDEQTAGAATLEERIEELEDKVCENQAASTATTVANIVTDLNALISKLKAAGLMAADPEPVPPESEDPEESDNPEEE